MKSDRAFEITQLAVLLSRQARADNKLLDSIIAEDAWKLASLSNRLHRYAEMDCNGELAPPRDLLVTHVREKVLKLLAPYGLRNVTFNTDPRGYSVYLHFSFPASNSWGGEEKGWGI